MPLDLAIASTFSLESPESLAITATASIRTRADSLLSSRGDVVPTCGEL